MNKIYIVVRYTWSYEGGDCLDCMYSGLDKYEVCRKCLEYVIKSLEASFMDFVHLYDEYKVISISDPTAFITSHMIEEQDSAKAVAEVMGLDNVLREAVRKRNSMYGYYVEKNDPNDILLQKQIINYLEKMKEG